jgi:hypothetical protein
VDLGICLRKQNGTRVCLIFLLGHDSELLQGVGVSSIALQRVIESRSSDSSTMTLVSDKSFSIALRSNAFCGILDGEFLLFPYGIKQM